MSTKPVTVIHDEPETRAGKAGEAKVRIDMVRIEA
jgi:hypothetical protein